MLYQWGFHEIGASFNFHILEKRGDKMDIQTDQGGILTAENGLR
jgi:hypothetical protein